MIAVKNDFSDRIEIDLLFAQAELTAAPADRSALMRAIRHIDQALKSVRAQKRAPSAPKRRNSAA
ncbi:hypothetical protein GJ654_17830 [Rhodoblastus acidophilus]|jgi:hypothetical protein|uniref:Uncharacterized protein n=1 Tax=Rhodoblastus acidophilus TaxID=1074 RepID=A0A6N8DQF8_RHOAC|nr:hypothetical protein [Rhodoblastus acidophilus]MCW2276177.1 hypothetical protein [Rhodoblastus acidophilus]MTV32842.1 hypothetical protein [Rhodoblastus acidophilus]